MTHYISIEIQHLEKDKCIVMMMIKRSHLQVFGVSVNQQLHIESLLFLCSTGYDLLLCCSRHLGP